MRVQFFPDITVSKATILKHRRVNSWLFVAVSLVNAVGLGYSFYRGNQIGQLIAAVLLATSVAASIVLRLRSRSGSGEATP